MQNQILIGMMVESLTPWAIGRLIALEGVQLMLFTPKGVNWKRNAITGLNLEKGRWIKRTLPFPNAVYNRCYSEQRPFINKLEQVIGTNKVFNYVTVFNKWEIYQVLSQGGLGNHLPATYLLEQQDIMEILNSEKSLILKPCIGHRGKNIYLLRQTHSQEFQLCEFSTNPKIRFTDSSSLQASLDRITQKHKPYLVQQKIPLVQLGDNVFDMRLLVQKDALGQWSVTGDLSRVAAREIFITNVCNKICSVEDVLEQVGIDSKQMLNKLIELSLLAAQQLENHFKMLGELSVDFGLDDRGHPWIIEVNGKPDKKLFFALSNIRLIEKVIVTPLEYACFLSYY